MSRSPHHWVVYLMPEDGHSDKLATPSGNNNGDLSDFSKFDLLMMETRKVLYRYVAKARYFTISLVLKNLLRSHRKKKEKTF